MSFIKDIIGGIFGATGNDGSEAIADATKYTTDRQIETFEKYFKTAMRHAKKANKAATADLVKGAWGAGNAARRAEWGAADAESAGVSDSANLLIRGGRGARDATLRGSSLAQRQLVDASQKGVKSLADWRTAGKQAIQGISSGLADGSFTMDGWEFEADPGYQFRLDAARKELDRSGSVRGNLLSGNQIAGAQNYMQGLASQEYGTAYERERADREARFRMLSETADRGYRAMGDTNEMRGDIGTARAAGVLDRTSARAGFANMWGKVRAGEASTLADLEANKLRTLGGINAKQATDIANVKAQGALNIADTANIAGARAAAGTSGAFSNYLTGMGAAAQTRAGETSIGQAVGGRVGTALTNWLQQRLGGGA